MISGGAFPERTTYKSGIFEVTGLGKWWPVTHPRIRADSDSLPEERTVAECEDGWVVRIGVSGMEKSSPHSHFSSRWPVVRVDREEEFTLSQLEDEIMMPLRALISIITHEPAECFNLKLQPVDGAYRPTFPVEVDPGLVSRGDNDSLGQVTFTPDQVDVKSFIGGWISMARQNIVPVVTAEPSDNIGFLQVQVVECVNAAEALHRNLHGEPDSFPFAEKVWNSLKGSQGLNRRERERVRSAVKFVERPLRERLEELAKGLGEEFCRWYFLNNTENWALVSSAVRNALSHGYKTSHGVEHDVSCLVGILRIMKSILALRLLVAAGLPTGSELVDLIQRDRAYLYLSGQSVADWHSLASKINSP
ncbi:hypothetical protein FNQ90_07030 [Streptomyces alkaliphilus]|uniref:Apea-like HEPN domain-containing protein n=1 Tax=Streptomyces alkaliphilus TaxID=1472722 RepID=A0A7W3Y135_9ACTN|nr:hypothetical protein [Streptomyces alkaliphilus]